MIGDGEKKSEIVARIKEKELEDKIILVGSKSNTEDYYQAMDCFVFPSLWEGLGIAALEAQAAGLKCIVSERVPKEVDIGCGLVDVVNLSDDLSVWSKTIIGAFNYERKNCIWHVKNAGYDVEDNANMLEQFYIESYEAAMKQKEIKR